MLLGKKDLTDLIKFELFTAVHTGTLEGTSRFGAALLPLELGAEAQKEMGDTAGYDPKLHLGQPEPRPQPNRAVQVPREPFTAD